VAGCLTCYSLTYLGYPSESSTRFVPFVRTSHPEEPYLFAFSPPHWVKFFLGWVWVGSPRELTLLFPMMRSCRGALFFTSRLPLVRRFYLKVETLFLGSSESSFSERCSPLLSFSLFLTAFAVENLTVVVPLWAIPLRIIGFYFFRPSYRVVRTTLGSGHRPLSPLLFPAH